MDLAVLKADTMQVACKKYTGENYSLNFATIAADSSAFALVYLSTALERHFPWRFISSCEKRWGWAAMYVGRPALKL